MDNGGGSYTVDQAINGEPCGVTTGGQLFTLALTATSDGTGTITVTDVAVRDCDNAPLPGIAGAPVNDPHRRDRARRRSRTLAASQVKLGNDGDGTTKIDRELAGGRSGRRRCWSTAPDSATTPSTTTRRRRRGAGGAALSAGRAVGAPRR